MYTCDLCLVILDSSFAFSWSYFYVFIDAYRYGQGNYNEFLGLSSVIVPFVACGDISGLDPDKSYPLQLSEDHLYEYKAPVQPPIHPNYHTYMQLQQNQQIR